MNNVLKILMKYVVSCNFNQLILIINIALKS